MNKPLILFILFIQLLQANAQVPFLVLDSTVTKNSLKLPHEMKYDILFREGELVKNNKGVRAISKGSQGHSRFIPQNNTSLEGFLYVSHECNDTSKVFGDGGGGTIFGIKQIGNTWVTTTKYQNIDFSSVGGTCMNTGTEVLANNKIIVCEKATFNSNREIYKKKKGQRDTSSFNHLKKWQNMGWVVEVDLKEKKAVKKLYAMGRFSHESVLIMPDRRTVFLTDNHSPAVFFKFIADTLNNFENGQLYAYRQNSDGLSGSWINLPRQKDSLIFSRELALKAGASIFFGLGGICAVNNKIFLTESGIREYLLNKQMCFNGKPAFHLGSYLNADKIDYPNGGILIFDPENNHMSNYISGGKGISNGAKELNNPNSITKYNMDNEYFLVIEERVKNKEKVGVYESLSESWWLDLSIENPSVDNLQRFLVGPAGAKIVNGNFTPDYKSFFLSIQHPSQKNKLPFNRSAVIVISGFRDRLVRERKIKTDRKPNK